MLRDRMCDICMLVVRGLEKENKIPSLNSRGKPNSSAQQRQQESRDAKDKQRVIHEHAVEREGGSKV